MAGPLEGVSVLEFTEVISGPLAGMILSDYGASVIKIEPPWGDSWRYMYKFSESESRPFMAYNRGKRNMTLDLKQNASKQIIKKLVKNCDVVVVNASPNVAENLGIGYSYLSSINDRLIYCENTAYGSYAGDGYVSGYDLVIQSVCGLIGTESRIDDSGRPEQIWSTPLIDTASGLNLVGSICAALYYREKTGMGQKIETNLLSCALQLMGMRLVEVESLDKSRNSEFVQDLESLKESGLSHKEIRNFYESRQDVTPGNIYYRTFLTSDGALAVACLNDPLRRKLLSVLNLEDTRFDVDYDPKSERDKRIGDQLVQMAESKFMNQTTAQWLDILFAKNIPAGPIRFKEELFSDSKLIENEFLVDVNHKEQGVVRMTGALARFSKSSIEIKHNLGELGEHTDEILEEYGFTECQRLAFRKHGVIK
jgi:CoA:oxalate CoA-transferase